MTIGRRKLLKGEKTNHGIGRVSSVLQKERRGEERRPKESSPSKRGKKELGGKGRLIRAHEAADELRTTEELEKEKRPVDNQ